MTDDPRELRRLLRLALGHMTAPPPRFGGRPYFDVEAEMRERADRRDALVGEIRNALQAGAQ